MLPTSVSAATPPVRDVETTTKLKPVAGPPNPRTLDGRPVALRVQLPAVPRLGGRHRHRLGTSGTVHVCRAYPGLVDARTNGGAW